MNRLFCNWDFDEILTLEDMEKWRQFEIQEENADYKTETLDSFLDDLAVFVSELDLYTDASILSEKYYSDFDNLNERQREALAQLNESGDMLFGVACGYVLVLSASDYHQFCSYDSVEEFVSTTIEPVSYND